MILECCVCSKATAFDQLFTWTRTMQAMEKWPFRVRARYYSWLRSHERDKIEKYEDPTTGLLVNTLCKEHTKQVIGEAGLLVSWGGLDALLSLNAKRDKYGPTFHVGPYMLQSRIYQRKWTVCSQGHPNALVKMPYDYESAYGWFDSVWESTKRPPTEASDAERYLCERLHSQSDWEKLSRAGQVRMHLVLGLEPPEFLSRQHHWRVTVVSDTISILGGYDPYPGTPRARAKTAVQRLIKQAYPDGPPVWADYTKDHVTRKEAFDKAWEYLEEKAQELWPDK